MGKAIAEPAPQAYAREALGRASLRAEFFLSIVRTVFCLLIAIRFVSFSWVWHVPGALVRGAVMLPPTVLAAGFSLVLLSRLRQGRVSPRLLPLSVIADTLVCTAALGSNVILPYPSYPGVMNLPEFSAFLATMFAASFRASSRLAIIGAITNGIGFLLLSVLDRVLNSQIPEPGPDTVSAHVILFGCTALLAILGARRIERLVEEAAMYSYKTTRAEQGLSTLLEGHHDAMSLLSAALFDVERLKSSETGQADVTNLSRDLEMLRQAVGHIKEQALREVLVLRPLVRVSLKAALEGPRATFGRMVAPAQVEWKLDTNADDVLVAGGALALQRLLANLLVNAREGDGERGATWVQVAVARDGDRVTIQVEDDGPGFPLDTAWPNAQGSEVETSKTGGSATGLRFVRAVAEASGGSLQVTNTPHGGRVAVTLRKAAPNTLG